MNIIILSDLNWEAHLRSITLREINDFTIDDLVKTRYYSIKKYYDIINNEEADLVLFAGDVTGDGSCGHGFHYAFILLLSILQKQKTPSFYIRGNHDEEHFYNTVNQWSAQDGYSQCISGKTINHNGLSILGIDYQTTKSKKELKALIAAQSEKYDIVLAHSQLKRRIRLFDFQTDYIFTGHYDRKIFRHRESTFISLDNDSHEISYAVLSKNNKELDQIEINILGDQKMGLSLQNTLLSSPTDHIIEINDRSTMDIHTIEQAPNSQLANALHDYIYLKYLRGIQYQKVLTTLYKIKSNQDLDEADLALDAVANLQITHNYRVSHSLIKDYLGSRYL